VKRAQWLCQGIVPDALMWCARRGAGSPPIQSRAVAEKAQDRKIADYFIFPACVHIKTDV
jgi:hypothetical protein